MSIRVVTDSSCDLPDEIDASFGISVVPMYVNDGTDSYLDGVDMSRQQFYEGLSQFEAHPTTSVPAPGQFVNEHPSSARILGLGRLGSRPSWNVVVEQVQRAGETRVDLPHDCGSNWMKDREPEG